MFLGRWLIGMFFSNFPGSAPKKTKIQKPVTNQFTGSMQALLFSKPKAGIIGLESAFLN